MAPAPFAPHTTGHWRLPDGWLVRVDVICGRWCASRFSPDVQCHDEVYGADEFVHEIARNWAHYLEPR